MSVTVTHLNYGSCHRCHLNKRSRLHSNNTLLTRQQADECGWPHPVASEAHEAHIVPGTLAPFSFMSWSRRKTSEIAINKPSNTFSRKFYSNASDRGEEQQQDCLFQHQNWPQPNVFQPILRHPRLFCDTNDINVRIRNSEVGPCVLQSPTWLLLGLLGPSPSCFNTLCYLSLSSITPSHSNAYIVCISAKVYVRASTIHSNVLKTNKHLQRVLTNLKTSSQQGTRPFTEVLFSKTS